MHTIPRNQNERTVANAYENIGGSYQQHETINAQKTKTMILSIKPSPEMFNAINGITINNTDHSIYLHREVNTRLNHNKEIKTH